MNQESLRIVLKTFSKGGFSEDEAVQLIEDLFDKTIINNYPYIPYYPSITYETPQPQHFEVTCKQ